MSADQPLFGETTEEVARYRARFYLLNKWERRLTEEDLDDTACVVRGYSPSGFQACTDVSEIGGLIVDVGGSEVHFRLYRDSTVGLIEAGVEPGRGAIMIDPMTAPCWDPTYLSSGVPETVHRVIDALGVTPRWADACPDGEHTFTVQNEGDNPYEFRKCTTCDNIGSVLSWLGHYVPRRVGGEDQ
jgi:hypothetical protein